MPRSTPTRSSSRKLPPVNRDKLKTIPFARATAIRLLDEVKATDHNDKELIEEFEKLPSRREMPLYYDVIKDPIDLQGIYQRVRKGRCRSFDDLYGLLTRMVDNAMEFNDPKSELYAFSKQLQRHIATVFSTFISEQPSQASSSSSSSSPSKAARAAKVDPAPGAGGKTEPTPVRSSSRPRKPKRLGDDEVSSELVRRQDAGKGSTKGGKGPDSGKQKAAAAPVPVGPKDATADLKNEMNSVIDTVVSAKKGTRQVADLFMELPTKKELPDYYEFISNPMDVNTIIKRVKRGQVKSLQQLQELFDLTFDNAKEYNKEKSQIHRDAVYLQRMVRSIISRKIAAAEQAAKREARSSVSSSTSTPASKRAKTGEPRKGSKSGKASPPKKEGRKESEKTKKETKKESEKTKKETKKESEKSKEKPKEKGKKKEDAHTPAIKIKLKAPTSDKKGKKEKSAETKEPSIKVKMKLPTRTPTKKQTPQEKCSALYDAVSSARSNDSEQRQLAEMFLELPPRDTPMYYDTISNPISMKEIKAKLNGNKYKALDECVADFKLMVDNAKEYNEPGSEVYQDAEALWAVVQKTVKELNQRDTTQATQRTPSSTKAERRASEKTKPAQKRPSKAATPSAAAAATASGGGGGAAAAASSSSTPTPRKQPARDGAALRRALPLPPPPDKPFGHSVRKYLLSQLVHFESEGEHIADPFVQLPSKEEYPDYYNTVAEPVSLWDIYEQMQSTRASEALDTDVQFVQRVCRVFFNAMVYNQEGTAIYNAAKKLHKQLQSYGNRCYDRRIAVQCAGLKPQPMLTSIGLEILAALRHPQGKDRRVLTEEFWSLPDPTEIEEYYRLIEKPIALCTIHHRLLSCAYGSLADLVNDFKLLFRNARVFNEQGSQVLKDSLELEKMFVEALHKTCTTHEVVSLSRHLTYEAMTEELDREQADVLSVVPVDSLEEGEVAEELAEAPIQPRTASTTSQAAVTNSAGADTSNETLHPNDYALVANQSNPEKPHVVLVDKIWKDKQGNPFVNVTYFYRPEETFHVPTRTFYKNEVLVSPDRYVHPLRHVLRKCLVLFVREYAKHEVHGFPEEDVFVVESRYSPSGKSIKPIKLFKQPTHPAFLTPRKPIPLSSIPKVKSIFYDSYLAAQSTGQSAAPRRVDQDSRNVKEETTPDKTRYSLFYLHDVRYGVGDYVYVEGERSSLRVFRINTIWTGTNHQPFFEGELYLQPHETRLDKAHSFFSNDVLRTTDIHTLSLLKVLGKLCVFCKKDYEAYAPLPLSMADTYLCQFDYDTVTRKMHRLRYPPLFSMEALTEYCRPIERNPLQKLPPQPAFHPPASAPADERQQEHGEGARGDQLQPQAASAWAVQGTEEPAKRKQPEGYTAAEGAAGRAEGAGAEEAETEDEHRRKRAKQTPGTAQVEQQQAALASGSGTPSSDATAKHHDRQHPSHISGFGLFCREERRRVRSTDPSVRLRAVDLTKAWLELSQAQRDDFDARAAANLQRREAAAHAKQTATPPSEQQQRGAPASGSEVVGRRLQPQPEEQQQQQQQATAPKPQTAIGHVLAAAQGRGPAAAEPQVAYSSEYMSRLQSSQEGSNGGEASEPGTPEKRAPAHGEGRIMNGDVATDVRRAGYGEGVSFPKHSKIVELFHVMSQLFMQGENPMNA